MASILDVIASETHGSSFKTYKYGFDGIEVPRFDYDDHQYHFTWKRYGETETHKKTVPLKRVVDQIVGTEPLFHYFLDGSRKTYKVDDMSYRNQIYPIIAGQVGVGCCLREQGEMLPLRDPAYERHLVISLPKVAKSSDWDDDELSFEYLLKKINARADLQEKGIEFAKIMAYSTSVEQGDKLNVDLCEELGASIYSFPMKYHPIEDPEYFDNRDFIGKHWNRKFIRTIQAVLNSTKGKVGRGHDFFCKAFGANEQEYFKLLYMPEAMIIYRFFFEGIGLTDQWWAAFSALSDEEMDIARPIIEKNVFTDIQDETDNDNVLNVLRYYCITRDDAERMMENP